MTVLGDSIKRIFSSDRIRKIAVVCGLALMVLILLSSFFGGKSDSKPKYETDSIDCTELEKKLEEKLKALILQIDGVGKVSVMVTVDRTEYVVYEKNNKADANDSEYSQETEVVLAGNSKEPLTVGKIMPVVRSAAIVCEGAGDPVIRERVANIAAKALDIGISRVYVAY